MYKALGGLLLLTILFGLAIIVSGDIMTAVVSLIIALVLCGLIVLGVCLI